MEDKTVLEKTKTIFKIELQGQNQRFFEEDLLFPKIGLT